MRESSVVFDDETGVGAEVYDRALVVPARVLPCEERGEGVSRCAREILDDVDILRPAPSRALCGSNMSEIDSRDEKDERVK